VPYFQLTKKSTIDYFVASDIIHIGVAGTSIIVLSSVDVAFDLLEQRSAIYSDRPVEIPSIPKDFKHVNIKDREHRWSTS
jgi:hypothetical protein